MLWWGSRSCRRQSRRQCKGLAGFSMQITPGDYKWKVKDYLIVFGSLAYVCVSILIMQFVSKVIGIVMLAVPVAVLLLFASQKQRKELAGKLLEAHERADAWYKKSFMYILVGFLVLFLAIWFLAK